jgi:hypothetical protein
MQLHTRPNSTPEVTERKPSLAQFASPSVESFPDDSDAPSTSTSRSCSVSAAVQEKNDAQEHVRTIFFCCVPVLPLFPHIQIKHVSPVSVTVLGFLVNLHSSVWRAVFRGGFLRFLET